MSSGKVIGSPKQQVEFKVGAGLFFSAFDSIKKVGYGFFLPEAQIEEKCSALVAELKSILGDSFKSAELKALGNAKSLKILGNHASDWIGLQYKSIEREQSKFDFLYLPNEGKIRLEKAQSERKATADVISPIKSGKTKVLIVDDSPTIRKLLTQIFGRDSSLEVVGAAELPSQVEGLINQHKPDVITLDIHMPEMNGIELLKKIYPKYSIPTVMITSISMEEGPLVLEALENGAVDYIQKPTLDQLEVVVPFIIEKVKVASQVRVKRELLSAGIMKPKSTSGKLDQSRTVVIGSSTGGTEALKELLIRMPSEIPPILVVQHIPPVFSEAFAKRLNELCPFSVKEAVDDEVIKPNTVYIAPGGRQMKVTGKREHARIKITDDGPVNRHKPSVDYLFDSILPSFGNSTVGIILTGMGSDGAKGLLKLKEGGCETIAQDEKSSIVFGMPREAIKLGAALQVKSLLEIPGSLCELLSSRKKAVA